MVTATQVLLAHLIDYAGMFPPAKLPLQAALSTYWQYRKSSPYAWMLGRFVCPAAGLPEVLQQPCAPEEAALLDIAALGQPNFQNDDVLTNVDTDVRTIQDFRQAWGSATVVGSLELALPKDAEVEPLLALLPALSARLEEANLRGFLEIPVSASWRSTLDKLSRALGELPRQDATAPIGLKLRCGGTTAEAFPSAEDVAAFILGCRAARLAWKATAGLHHPWRRWDASLQVWQHGFLNVFAAGVLAFSSSLNEADLLNILGERDHQSLRFTADGIVWKDWTCPVAQIDEIRAAWVTSFGSCSFEEPVEDLLALGLLE